MAQKRPLVAYGAQYSELLAGDTLLGSATASGSPTASKLGYNAWSFDPAYNASNRTLTSSTMWAAATYPSAGVAAGGTLNIEHQVGGAGATFTYARLGVYLYNAGTGTSTLIGTSADLSTTWNSTGAKTVPVTISSAITAGDTVYIAALAAASTSPALASATASLAAGRGSPLRFGVLTGQSSLPASITQAQLATTSNLPFFAY